MIFDITRLTNLAGQDFTNPKCRVRSPHITARESIEIGDYIVAQQERIAELEKEQATLLSCLLGISNRCIGEIAMNHRLDAQMIGESIYAATGKTLARTCKSNKGEQDDG